MFGLFNQGKFSEEELLELSRRGFSVAPAEAVKILDTLSFANPYEEKLIKATVSRLRSGFEIELVKQGHYWSDPSDGHGGGENVPCEKAMAPVSFESLENVLEYLRINQVI
jgi:hypothetical protein